MRKIALFLSMIVVLASMVGCTNASGSTSGETSKHPSGLEPVTLKCYLIGSPQQDLPLVLEALNAYTEEKINATIDPMFLEGAKIDGDLYAIPTKKEIGQQAVLVFNKGLVDKYNLDVTSIKTLADLDPLLKVIKENEPSVTPIATFDAFLPFDSVLQEEMPFAFDVESGYKKERRMRLMASIFSLFS